MQLALMIFALACFFFSAFSPWFPGPDRPYHPSLISLGLFFATLSFLWPQIGH